MEDNKTKICKLCNIERPIDDFPIDRRAKDNHRIICKLCLEKAKEAKKKKQPELIRVKGFLS